MVVLGRVLEGIAGRTPRIGYGNDERAPGVRHVFAACWPKAVSGRERAELFGSYGPPPIEGKWLLVTMGGGVR